jgi:hypothetical protein
MGPRDKAQVGREAPDLVSQHSANVRCMSMLLLVRWSSGIQDQLVRGLAQESLVCGFSKILRFSRWTRIPTRPSFGGWTRRR